VVPIRDELNALEGFFARVVPVLESCAEDYEIVCVNDGSRDGSLDLLREQQVKNPHLVIVDLTRNFGKESALTAGLDQARMNAVIPIDADLQDPPEVIPEMVARWQEGFDMVYGKRRDRSSDGFLKRWTAGLFYRLYNALAEDPIPPDTGDFRLMDRRVVQAVLLLQERNRFMKGLFNWVGYRSVAVEYERESRTGGESKFSFFSLWNFALDGITASTILPLRFASYFGLVVSIFALAYFVALLVKIFIYGRDLPGYASLMLGQLLIGGVQLMAIGIIGEYLGRLVQETKKRPLYLIREVLEGQGGQKQAPES
jgi:glycosyltransferase involved in cell wall biosynthesis